MAERLAPEKEAEWEAKMADPNVEVTPEQRAAWTWYREQFPVQEDKPLPDLVPEPAAAAPVDPRQSSSWYGRALEHLTGASSGMTGGGGGAYRPAADVTPGGGGTYEEKDLAPGAQTDASRNQYAAQRWALAEGLRLAPMLYTGPMAAAPYILRGTAATLPRVVNAVKGPAINAATNAALTYGSEHAANAVYPEKPTNPGAAAGWSAVPQYLFEQAGRYVKPAAQWLFKGWQATPEGRVVGETVESLGGKSTPAMYNEGYAPGGTQKGIELSPPGGHVRTVAEDAQRRVEAEVQRQRVSHTADKVDQESDRLLAPVAAQSNPAALDTTPELAQMSLGKQLEKVDTYVHKNFQDMDTHLAQLPAGWRGQPVPGGTSAAQTALTSFSASPDPAAVALATRMGKADALTAALPASASVGALTQAYKETRGALHQAEQLLAQIRSRRPPGTVPNPRQAPNPLEQALEHDVIPALHQQLTPLEQHLSPYLVDITAPKQWAQGRVGRWEDGLKTMTPEEASKALIPQDVKAAQELLAKDDFVTFQEAQQYRSDLLKVSRTRGPNIGDSASKEAGEASRVIWQAMNARAQTVPGLKAMHDFANVQFAKAAEMWNSPYLMEKTDANLDDLLTGLIESKRPNDMKTLREALGQHPNGRPVFDDVAQMWLTQKLEAAKRHGGGEISNARALLNELENMTEQVERQVFPGGELFHARQQLRNVVDMQDAVKIARQGDTASAHELQKLKTRLSGDPALWEAVQSDVLAGVLKPAESQVHGATILSGLDSLRNIKGVLFRPDQFEALDRLAKTTTALQKSAVSRSSHWSPVVRAFEHGGVMVALGGLAYYTGHPGAAAAAGAAYMIGTAALSRMLTNPKIVHALADGFATSRSAQDASRIFGTIMGELASKGMSGDIEALTEQQIKDLEAQKQARGGKPLPPMP